MSTDTHWGIMTVFEETFTKRHNHFPTAMLVMPHVMDLFFPLVTWSGKNKKNDCPNPKTTHLIRPTNLIFFYFRKRHLFRSKNKGTHDRLFDEVKLIRTLTSRFVHTLDAFKCAMKCYRKSKTLLLSRKLFTHVSDTVLCITKYREESCPNT